jgi:capsular exopolysaccharide synthesis family protein
VELRDYLLILRKRWIVILTLTLVGVAAGAAATLMQTPKYEASTLVFVSVPSSNNAGDLAQGGSFVQNQVASYAEVVSTPRVLNSVIKQLHLSVSASKLAESVSASAPQSTVNIEIVVTADSPTDAANIANATTASFSKTIASITTPPGGGASQVSVSVLRDATVPSSPSSPNTSLNLALGLLVGLAIGIGIAVLREVLDTVIRGERDVAAITTSPIVGGLAFDPTAVKRPLIVHDDPQSVRAEAFRTLRTNLQFLDADSGSKSFVITSSIPGEGKTTTAANIAIALSDSGLHVAVIDADLRRPKLANYLGLEGAIGLSDVLISRVSLADALQPWGRRHLVVLPAGTVPPNPSELLGSRAMATLLKTLESEFDVVILDMPPLLPVTDAALVSKLVRGTLVVVAAGRAHKGEFAAALASLEKVSTPAAGIIMTMLPAKGPDAYGRYGYGYGYTQQGYSSAPTTNPATALGLTPPARAGLSAEWGRPDSKSRV